MALSARNVRPTIAEVDAMSSEDFVAALGSAVEHSPWVALEAWRRRPFGSVAALQLAFEAAMRSAPRERRLELLRAHPELAGREAAAGQLTGASAREQRAARLDRLAADELAALTTLNADYRARFGFPFIACVREHSIESLLAWARARLARELDEEAATALAEVGKIAGRRPGHARARPRLDRGREWPHGRRRPHRAPGLTTRGGELPAALRHRRLLRGRRHAGVLPRGDRGIRRRASRGAPPRAAPAEPLRLLDLPGQLIRVPIGDHRYGKSDVRLVKLERGPERHDLRDLTVDLMLEGDYEAVHTEGDNSGLVATDTMRNVVYALAAERPLESLPDFAASLVEHFLAHPRVTGALARIRENPWQRLPGDHPHAWQRGAGGTRVEEVRADPGGMGHSAGIEG